jgi:putative transposase
MAWGEIKVEEERMKFINTYLQGELTMAELCRLHNISRKNGYKWLNRYKNGGVEALTDQSRAPLKQALKTDPEIAREILEVRFNFPSWGPKKVRAWLETNHPEIIWPSTTTIGNLFDINGLTVPRRYRRRVPAKTVPLSHCQQPNDVWCTDFKGWFLTGDGQKCDPLTLTDAASRFILRCLKINKNDIDHVWSVLEAAFREYGLPLFLRNDNGAPFASCGVGRLSGLSIKLIKAGVTPEWIDPGKPQQNGRHERMHLTLKKETATPPELTLDEQAMKFKEFIHYFNFIRPHEAIDQRTPGSLYRLSQREWKGVFKSPEYSSDYIIRKVKDNGSIKLKGFQIYLGRVLGREPVGLQEIECGAFRVHYGPIILGVIDQNKNFILPQGNKRKRIGK